MRPLRVEITATLYRSALAIIVEHSVAVSIHVSENVVIGINIVTCGHIGPCPQIFDEHVAREVPLWLTGVTVVSSHPSQQRLQLAKMAELERAAAEVAIFDEYVGALETVHATEVAEVDWEAIANADEPPAPSESDAYGRDARDALEKFKPKRLESKKRQAARLQALDEAVPIATQRDQAEYEVALAQHAKDMDEWRSAKAMAEGVIEGEVGALADASRQIEDMAGGEFLRYVELVVSDDSPTVATVGVASIEDIVPTEQKALLGSGKLSVKQMPKGRYYELYQDYVCGSSLLVANTILGMLPVPELIVTAQSEMLNTATGHAEESPILSIFVPRETVARLNLSSVDASDAMSNFTHNMKFLKTKGFQPIEQVSPPGST